MKQIHLVMPFMRLHLKDMLIAAYRPMNIVWHPIMFQDEVTEFNEPWIFPLIIPMDSKECTVFMPGCFKRNWFIKNEKIIDEDYIFFVEHQCVFTLGRRGGRENLTVSKKFLSACRRMNLPVWPGVMAGRAKWKNFYPVFRSRLRAQT